MSATISIARERSAWRDRLVSYEIVIDDKVVGTVKSGETQRHSVSTGRHRVRVMADKRHGSGEWGVKLSSDEEARFSCRPARGILTVGKLLSKNDWIDLQPSDEN